MDVRQSEMQLNYRETERCENICTSYYFTEYCLKHMLHTCSNHPDTASFYFHILSALICMLGHQIQILACGSFVKRCWNLSHTLLCHPLTLPSFLSPFFIDDRTCVIFPLVKAFCEKCFKGDEAVLASLSFQYGKLCHGLSGDCPLPF